MCSFALNGFLLFNDNPVQTTERLPTEIETVENTRSHLLTAGMVLFTMYLCVMSWNEVSVSVISDTFLVLFVEQLKLLQLRHLQEELDELTKQT